jgi:hypothetical protein
MTEPTTPGAQVLEPRDAMARRLLWLAFCWNDHNFGAAHEEARKEAALHGITSFEQANAWLATQPPPQPDQAVMRQALEALVLLDDAFCADDYSDREGRIRGRKALTNSRAAVASLRAALSATQEVPR